MLAKNGQSAEVRDITAETAVESPGGLWGICVRHAPGFQHCSGNLFFHFRNWSFLEIARGFCSALWTVQILLWKVLCLSGVHVELNEGTALRIKAIGVNAKNIISEVASGKYIIVLKTPAAPVVYPKSGDFSKETTIKVSVPELNLNIPNTQQTMKLL